MMDQEEVSDVDKEQFYFEELPKQCVMMPAVIGQTPILVQNTEAAFVHRRHIIETASKIWPELKQVEVTPILHLTS